MLLPVRTRILCWLFLLSLSGGCHWAQKSCIVKTPCSPILGEIRQDHANFYSRDSLLLLSAGMGVGGTMANTSIDEDIQFWYQNDVRSQDSDDFATTAKLFGEGKYIFPILASGLLLGELAPDFAPSSTLGEWGDRGLRAMLVGAPSLLGLQLATGASRPREDGSDWIPLSDNNGVSGHAFVGAVPFITAAKMSDNRIVKAGFYTASGLAAWSRVNDNAHYTSQAILGWWLGYLACTAVDSTESEAQGFRLTAVPIPGGTGLGIVFER